MCHIAAAEVIRLALLSHLIFVVRVAVPEFDPSKRDVLFSYEIEKMDMKATCLPRRINGSKEQCSLAFSCDRSFRLFVG